MAEAVIGTLKRPFKPELIYDDEYRHPIVASSYMPHTSLLSNVKGEPFLVEWYRQVQGDDTEVQGFQPDSIETYQSYEKIKGLIIKIDSPISQNFDTTFATMGQTGTGYVLFDLAPLPFDLFIADIGDGRAGLFQLSEEPRIRSVAMDKVYEITFSIIAIVNRDIETNLTKKTVKTLVYSKDSAIRGGNALLTTTEFDEKKTLAKLETVLIQDYLSAFYYEPERTVVVPTGDDTTYLRYDPYLAHFLANTFTPKKTGLRHPIQTLSTLTGKSTSGTRKLNIWDMFYQMNFDYPQRYKTKYYLFSSTDLLNTLYYGGVFFSKLDQVILTEPQGAAATAYRAGYNIGFNPYWSPFPTVSGNGTQTVHYKGTPHPDFFSDAFYQKADPDNPVVLPQYEQFIMAFFRDQSVDPAALIKQLEGYWDLTPLQQAYLGGIYVLAIRIALSSTYRYL